MDAFESSEQTYDREQENSQLQKYYSWKSVLKMDCTGHNLFAADNKRLWKLLYCRNIILEI